MKLFSLRAAWLSLTKNTTLSAIGLIPLLWSVTLSANFVDMFKVYPIKGTERLAAGIALGDVNKDGQLDIVVASGSDISPRPVQVWINSGDFKADPFIAGWKSEHRDYHAKVALGDINGDSWLDIVVAVQGSTRGATGYVIYYLNDGKGSFSPKPDWVSANEFNAWRPVLVDLDKDGDLDLMVSSIGWYWGKNRSGYIYLNNNGKLSKEPSWSSSEWPSNGSIFALDFNQDGILDVVAPGSELNIFLGSKNGLPSKPDLSIPAGMRLGKIIDGVMFDMDNNKLPELILSENHFGFKIFWNFTSGHFNPSQSTFEEVGGEFATTLGPFDLDRDGQSELIVGGWFNWRHSIYKGTQSNGFELADTYEWGRENVFQAIEFGDLNKDGKADYCIAEWHKESVCFISNK
jgi:hypothetical protein